MVNAGEIGRSLAALHLNMTAVDVIEVEPAVSL